jgi:hypothetical protein
MKKIDLSILFFVLVMSPVLTNYYDKFIGFTPEELSMVNAEPFINQDLYTDKEKYSDY